MTPATLPFALLALGAFLQSAAMRIHGPNDAAATMFGLGVMAVMGVGIVVAQQPKK